LPEIYPIKLSGEGEKKLKAHLRNRILALEEGLRELHEDKLPKWRKAYEAVPREQHREWPFPNASNVVVPIIAIHSDTLLARTMTAVVRTSPIWYSKIYGDHGTDGDELRSAFEDAMQYVGIEPYELDLYRVYHEWFGEAIKYGTSTVKLPWEKIYEDQLIPAGDGSGDYDFLKQVQYEGPRPEKLPFEDFLCPPAAKTLDAADIKIHRIRMMRHTLEERRFTQAYTTSKVDEILGSPDKTSPSINQAMREDTLGAKTSSSYGYEEYHIYECYLKWRGADGKAPRIIATYHKKTDTLLRVIFDTNPLQIFVSARLFYRDDMFYGYGFCETLWSFQEEISEIHNQRRDNQTVANTKVWRVDPDSKLHSGFRIFPSAMLPAGKDEIEPLEHGSVSSLTIDEEKLSLDLAERRSGVSPPQQGYGAGTQTKKGVYSAAGTMALLQDGNRRTDLNISDFRYAHTILGRIVSRQYAEYGFGKQRGKLFGAQEDIINDAFKAIKGGTLGIPIYSSNASINREVEKQNDMMLHQIMNQHYQMISTLITQMSNPLVPQEVKDYGVKVINASDTLMKIILKDFGHDEVERLVPKAEVQKPQAPPQQQKQQGSLPMPGGAGGQNRPVPINAGKVSAMAGRPGGPAVPIVPSGTEGQ
jgi:hypothetical protein